MLKTSSLPVGLSLCPAKEEDQAFMERLFRSARPHLELIDMPSAFIDALVKQQYQLQKNHYETHWPNAVVYIILLDSDTIGRIIVDKGESLIHLVDIALMPDHRGKGIGTALLHTIQATAAKGNAVIRLSVDKQNTAAKSFYSALGFKVVDEVETHETMAWRPDRQR